MDENVIQDLKQFIAATVSQQTSEIVVRLDKVEQKIDDLSHSVAEAIENTNESTDTQLKDHEHRITRLEHKAA